MVKRGEMSPGYSYDDLSWKRGSREFLLSVSSIPEEVLGMKEIVSNMKLRTLCSLVLDMVQRHRKVGDCYTGVY